MSGDVDRRAVRFFWCTLFAATGASVAGNIAHALLAAPGHVSIAAAASVVPPAVLLTSTHGVALRLLREAPGRMP
jgi:hypothetical protein